RHALATLGQAERLRGSLGTYGLQAEIAACHARAHTADDTDWMRIAALYDALSQLSPSPVVELNRAVAVAMAFGPEAGLEIVDELRYEKSLERYHLLPAVRGDLLAKLGRHGEAQAEFKRAASLTQNVRERELLLDRAAASGRPTTDPPPNASRAPPWRWRSPGPRAAACARPREREGRGPSMAALVCQPRAHPAASRAACRAASRWRLRSRLWRSR